MLSRKMKKNLFRDGICWTKVTSYPKPAFRYVDEDTLYECAKKIFLD